MRTWMEADTDADSESPRQFKPTMKAEKVAAKQAIKFSFQCAGLVHASDFLLLLHCTFKVNTNRSSLPL